MICGKLWNEIKLPDPYQHFEIVLPRTANFLTPQKKSSLVNLIAAGIGIIPVIVTMKSCC